jgi:4-hydroxythreonine-4-phosphate dehydrogenase
MGDPAGIGPEVALRAHGDRDLARLAEMTLVGDPAVVEQWSSMLSLSPEGAVIDCGASAGIVEPGRPTSEGAASALASIEVAARMCMAGQADAMVTAPVSKEAIAATGVPFQGHTEFLASFTRADDVVMTFIHGKKRVALVTTHLPLRDVSAALTTDLVLCKLKTLATGLTSWLRVENPLIAVTALNPHASEGGRFGDEEERVIAPAIALAREAGIDADGPYPADSVFVGHGESGGGPGSTYDAILAMYHDQGTVAAKLWGFGSAVNVSLGLPIVRTSVDHGTAYSIAGRSEANPGSMLAAVRLAAEIALNRLEARSR